MENALFLQSGRGEGIAIHALLAAGLHVLQLAPPPASPTNGLEARRYRIWVYRIHTR